jgi:exopolysaccharide biosynthesis protein
MMMRIGVWVILALGAGMGFVVGSGAEIEWTLENSRHLGKIAGGGEVVEAEVRRGEQTAKVTSISFNEKDLYIYVTENPEVAPEKLRGFAPSQGAVAGCNASYFHADGEPIGLVVSEGRELHHKERARLLSGILAVRKGRMELVRSENFRGTDGVSEAIQAGPWLLEGGRPTTGLDSTKRARRTVIAKGECGRWAMVALSPLTLADTAEVLATGGAVPGMVVREALNLDGGSSTALWAATDDTEVSVPEFGTVRNFLLLKPRR